MRAVLFCSALAAAGCAHQAGKAATAGAVAGLEQQRQQVKEQTGQYPLQILGSNAAQGVVDAMTSPEQAERLQELAGQMASAAVARALEAALAPGATGTGESPIEVASAEVARTLQRELARATAEGLGARGEGPLGQALAGTSAAMSGAATQGVLRAFFPECAAGEPRCLDRRLAELAQESAAGAMRGLGHAIGWLVVAGSFVAGVIATLLLVVTLRLVRRGGGTEAPTSRRTAEA